jgi:hypothetical protein
LQQLLLFERVIAGEELPFQERELRLESTEVITGNHQLGGIVSAQETHQAA